VAPTDVLSVQKAKDHLNALNITEPGGEGELADMIGAAVGRVERHLGRSLEPGPATGVELLACKVVLAEYWRTQRPGAAGRRVYGAQAAGAQETGPVSGAPIEVKLEDLLGPPADDAASSPQGSFPPPVPYPDPILPLFRGRAPW
jgi:hypothetical protein